MKLKKHAGAIVLFVTILSFLGAIRTGVFEREHYQKKDLVLSESSQSAEEGAARPVFSGIYVKNIYNFNAASVSFDADGWLWLTWDQSVQTYFDKNGIDVNNVIEFVNAIDMYEFNLTPAYEKPIRLPDGRFYQNFQFSGHFYINDIRFRQYPFEKINIPIELAFKNSMAGLSAHDVKLVADKEMSGVGEFIDILGYHLLGYEIESRIHQFSGNFGMQDLQGKNRRMSELHMDIAYARSINASLLQLCFPLIIVMSVVLGAPSLSASLWDTRLNLPPLILLTLVYMQQGYRGQIPQLPYLTFLDTVYNNCYLATLLLYVLFVWSSNKLDSAAITDRQATIAYINKIDSRAGAAIILFLIIVVSINFVLMFYVHPGDSINSF